jgi:1-acyl-sn-glycerol-3-phosphate acyltransferase
MKWLAERYLKLRGWKFIGDLPDVRKFIVIGAPHTSNWDFVIYLAAISHWNFKPRYLGKHSLFEGPFGWLFRRWGGIPVDRSKPGGLIAQVAAEFESSDDLVLVIAPEGTRKAADFWKSGFLAIARAVDVPIVPACLNFEKKLLTVGDPIPHTGNIDNTMNELRTIYAGATGRNPEGMGPVRVKEESSPSS